MDGARWRQTSGSHVGLRVAYTVQQLRAGTLTDRFDRRRRRRVDSALRQHALV